VGHYLNLNNNTLINAIVNTASNISYRTLLEAADTGRCFAVHFMKELTNLTNVVLGKLGKFLHKETVHTLFLFSKL